MVCPITQGGNKQKLLILTWFLSATDDSKYVCNLTSFELVEHFDANLPVTTEQFTCPNSLYSILRKLKMRGKIFHWNFLNQLKFKQCHTPATFINQPFSSLYVD